MGNRFFYFSVTFVLLIAGLGVYDNYFRKRIRAGQQNEARVGSVRMGMNELDMMKIMGNPNSISLSYRYEKTFCYTSNNTNFRDIEIYVDTNNRVSKVLIPDKQ